MKKKKLTEKVADLFKTQEEIRYDDTHEKSLIAKAEDHLLRIDVAKAVGYLDVRMETTPYHAGLSLSSFNMNQEALRGYLPSSNKVYGGGREVIPEYTTSIREATGLIENLQNVSIMSSAGGGWMCAIGTYEYQNGKTMAEAICKAFVYYSKNRPCQCDANCKCHKPV